MLKIICKNLLTLKQKAVKNYLVVVTHLGCLQKGLFVIFSMFLFIVKSDRVTTRRHFEYNGNF